MKFNTLIKSIKSSHSQLILARGSATSACLFVLNLATGILRQYYVCGVLLVVELDRRC
jgi:hypothetical protein